MLTITVDRSLNELTQYWPVNLATRVMAFQLNNVTTEGNGTADCINMVGVHAIFDGWSGGITVSWNH